MTRNPQPTPPAEVQTPVEALEAAVKLLDGLKLSAMADPAIRTVVEALQTRSNRLVWSQSGGAPEFRA